MPSAHTWRQNLRLKRLSLVWRPTVANSRLLHGDLAQSGDDRAFGQVAVANHLAAALGVKLLTSFQPLSDFHLDSLGKQLLGAVAEDARQNIPGRDWQANIRSVNFLHGGVLLGKKFVGKTPFSPSTPPSSTSRRTQHSVIAPFRPDVVLLDIGLPDMDGWELAPLLRKDNPALKIVAITAYQSWEDQQNSKDAGIDLHIGKPIQREQILELLATVAAD